MKYVLSALILALSVTPLYADQDEYDECILKHMKEVKLDYVASLIMQACRENYKSPGFTNARKKSFNECLLENLPGIESVPAAMEIKDVCYRKSQKGIK